MNTEGSEIEKWAIKKSNAKIWVETLGGFQLSRSGQIIKPKDWSRDSTAQLFQFFITNRRKHSLHKEQILDRLWGDIDPKSGQQNFKVALHGINKILDPQRKKRTESKFIIRQGATYMLLLDEIWLDVEEVEHLIFTGNQFLGKQAGFAIAAYQQAIQRYNGIYLPNRLYEDWASEERERIQLLILSAYINLSELLLASNPAESIRLCQEVLQIDNSWEDAYRIQMSAYLNKGNRPMALKTYESCQRVLMKEFGINPLPETRQLYQSILGI